MIWEGVALRGPEAKGRALWNVLYFEFQKLVTLLKTMRKLLNKSFVCPSVRPSVLATTSHGVGRSRSFMAQSITYKFTWILMSQFIKLKEVSRKSILNILIRWGKLVKKICGFIPLIQASRLDGFIPLVQASQFENTLESVTPRNNFHNFFLI
jgi:hypothetical protein